MKEPGAMELEIDIHKKLPGFELDIRMEAGREIVGILGASGSGKSMLLRCVAGLVKPDRGRIVVNGKTLYDSARKIDLHPQARRTGFLFQNYALFPHMTVEENIGFGISAGPADARKQRVAMLLEQFHIGGIHARYPSQISGGQQQRAALARALAAEPEILLLDEPFSALDEHLKMLMMKEMGEALKSFGGTALFVTHNMQEVYRLSDSIAVIGSGRLVVRGPKRHVFQDPRSVEAARVTGCKNIAAAKRLEARLLNVPEWQANLITDREIFGTEGYAGIRANHIRLATDPVSVNRLPVHIADISEAPFRVSLFLKIGKKPLNADDYDVQWEIGRDEWDCVRRLPQPFEIRIPPEHLFFMEH